MPQTRAQLKSQTPVDDDNSSAGCGSRFGNKIEVTRSRRRRVQVDDDDEDSAAGSSIAIEVSSRPFHQPIHVSSVRVGSYQPGSSRRAETKTSA